MIEREQEQRARGEDNYIYLHNKLQLIAKVKNEYRAGSILISQKQPQKQK